MCNPFLPQKTRISFLGHLLAKPASSPRRVVEQELSRARGRGEERSRGLDSYLTCPVSKTPFTFFSWLSISVTVPQSQKPPKSSSHMSTKFPSRGLLYLVPFLGLEFCFLRSGFLNLSAIHILGWIILSYRGLPQALQDVQPHLWPLLTRCQQHPPTPCSHIHQVVTTKNISRCQMSLERQNHPSLRITALDTGVIRSLA